MKKTKKHPPLAVQLVQAREREADYLNAHQMAKAALVDASNLLVEEKVRLAMATTTLQLIYQVAQHPEVEAAEGLRQIGNMVATLQATFEARNQGQEAPDA